MKKGFFMITLGKIERIDDLRTIWPHEALDFTKWLSKEENLELLGNSIGIDIILQERESSVGSFNVDIFATEQGTGRKIIIENQLEDTNHDHLGKIITYASGKGAEVIVWIVKRARDEHVQAIEWLNQHTDENIGFFLLEIELWRINNSLPAPKFTVVERPNDWAKTLKVSSSLSDYQKLQLNFWQSFIDYAYNQEVFKKTFSKRKAQPQHWYDVGIGSSVCHIAFTINSQKKYVGTELYFQNDKDLFFKFKDKSAEIENMLSSSVEWRVANKDCRMLITKNCDVRNNPDEWTNCFTWFCEMGIKLREIALRYGV